MSPMPVLKEFIKLRNMDLSNDDKIIEELLTRDNIELVYKD